MQAIRQGWVWYFFWFTSSLSYIPLSLLCRRKTLRDNGTCSNAETVLLWRDKWLCISDCIFRIFCKVRSGLVPSNWVGEMPGFEQAIPCHPERLCWWVCLPVQDTPNMQIRRLQSTPAFVWNFLRGGTSTLDQSWKNTVSLYPQQRHWTGLLFPKRIHLGKSRASKGLMIKYNVKIITTFLFITI